MAVQKEWREQMNEINSVVDEDTISAVVSSMTGVPLTRLEEAESQRLLQLEDELHETVISQHDAITQIAKAIRKSRSGLKDPNRPMGSFLFLRTNWCRQNTACKSTR